MSIFRFAVFQPLPFLSGNGPNGCAIAFRVLAGRHVWTEQATCSQFFLAESSPLASVVSAHLDTVFSPGRLEDVSLRPTRPPDGSRSAQTTGSGLSTSFLP